MLTFHDDFLLSIARDPLIDCSKSVIVKFSFVLISSGFSLVVAAEFSFLGFNAVVILGSTSPSTLGSTSLGAHHNSRHRPAFELAYFTGKTTRTGTGNPRGTVTQCRLGAGISVDNPL
jgi:hypothetical protein